MVCIEQLPQKCSETFVRRQQIAGLLKPARSWQISALFLHKLSGHLLPASQATRRGRALRSTLFSSTVLGIAKLHTVQLRHEN